MSGYSEDALANQGGLARGVTYLRKPFDPDELAALVREVLGAFGRRRTEVPPA